MTTPENYRQRINNAIREMPQNGQQLSFSSKSEATAYMRQLTQMQKELRLIKREISRDMKEIRDQYREASSKARATGLASEILTGKRWASQRVSRTMQHTASEKRDKALKPYDELATAIDSFIDMLEKAKLQIERVITVND